MFDRHRLIVGIAQDPVRFTVKRKSVVSGTPRFFVMQVATCVLPQARSNDAGGTGDEVRAAFVALERFVG